MYELRKGIDALKDVSARRRLSELSQEQLVAVGDQLMKFKPNIASAWKADRGRGAVLILEQFEMTETARDIFNRVMGGGASPTPRTPPPADRPTLVPPPELPPEQAWPKMAGAAYHGLAGRVVKLLEPHTEADPAAILIQFLTAAGNIIGRQPHYRVESDTHHANLFTVLVGESSKARKGTSWGRICEVARGADENWYLDRNKGGLSSGEGLINEVRDPVEKFDAEAGMMKMIDPGVTDKRLMVIEPEFAGALLAADRHGNTLPRSSERAGMEVGWRR